MDNTNINGIIGWGENDHNQQYMITVKNDDKTSAKKAPKAKGGSKSSSIVRKAGRGK